MFSRVKAGKRFSLLLLEDEEYYVQDWVAACRWPAEVEGNWQSLATLPGRLRLCTKSLFFEPDDVRIPIVRIPFKTMNSVVGDGSHAFTAVATQVVKMKPNMLDVPYVFEKGKPSTWHFSLPYANSDVAALANAQLEMSRLPHSEQLQALQTFVRRREDALVFDCSRLVDFSERVLLDCPAVQVGPLVREPGRLVVSEQRLYFQPLHNVVGDAMVRSQALAAVAAVARRRCCLRPTGLELFFLDQGEGGGGRGAAAAGWDAPSALFEFRTPEAREQAASVLTSQELLGSAVPRQAASAPAQRGLLLEAHSGWLRRVTMAWQTAAITNFDYLLYLNLAAGRSFNDLAQWPVFPWVLSNYSSAELDLDDPGSYRDLSKPIGALNPQRLQDFKNRFREMSSVPSDDAGSIPPFLYGTHYSTPGYVMHWLVRAAPAHMLRLQAGRFDVPDRLFSSLAEAWDSATRSSNDVKELIPEFFMPNTRFLLNESALPLGVRQNGTAVAHVGLPPWASSAQDFLAKHRAALESPHVSANLHNWIDLIFGYKQRGQAAVDADNVFYYMTYEGAVDSSTPRSLVELRALEAQINEFGQTPCMLFNAPHPPRLVTPPAPDPAAVFATPAMDTSRSSGSRVSPRAPSAAGDDVSGRSLALALLSTIMAAAATDEAEDSPAPSPGNTAASLIERLSLTSGTEHISLTSSMERLSLASHTPGNNGLTRGSPPAAGGGVGGPGLAGAVGEELAGDSPSIFQEAGPASTDRFLDELSAALEVPPSPGLGDLVGVLVATPPRLMKLDSNWEEGPVQRTEEPRAGSGAGASASGRAGGWAERLPGQLQLLTSRQVQVPRQAEPLARGGASEPLPLNALAGREGVLYCGGEGGTLYALNLWDLAPLRTARLEGHILSLQPLPPSGSDPASAPLLVGTHKGLLHAFLPDAGYLLGSFSPHGNGIAAMSLVQGGAGQQLLTGSYDCTVKIWRLAEGRQPWSSSTPVPEAEIQEFDAAAVWALAVSSSGNTLVAGTDDGSVVAWDLRSHRQIWQVQASMDYVRSLALTPDGQHVIVASGDSQLQALEFRRGGTRFAGVHCGASLRCCAADATLAVAGSELGLINMWDLQQVLQRAVPGSHSAAGPDGLYASTACGSPSSIEAMLVDQLGTADASFPYLVTAQYDGVVTVFTA